MPHKTNQTAFQQLNEEKVVVEAELRSLNMVYSLLKGKKYKALFFSWALIINCFKPLITIWILWNGRSLRWIPPKIVWGLSFLLLGKKLEVLELNLRLWGILLKSSRNFLSGLQLWPRLLGTRSFLPCPTCVYSMS